MFGAEAIEGESIVIAQMSEDAVTKLTMLTTTSIHPDNSHISLISLEIDFPTQGGLYTLFMPGLTSELLTTAAICSGQQKKNRQHLCLVIFLLKSVPGSV